MGTQVATNRHSWIGISGHFKGGRYRLQPTRWEFAQARGALVLWASLEARVSALPALPIRPRWHCSDRQSHVLVQLLFAPAEDLHVELQLMAAHRRRKAFSKDRLGGVDTEMTRNRR